MTAALELCGVTFPQHVFHRDRGRRFFYVAPARVKHASRIMRPVFPETEALSLVLDGAVNELKGPV